LLLQALGAQLVLLLPWALISAAQVWVAAADISKQHKQVVPARLIAIEQAFGPGICSPIATSVTAVGFRGLDSSTLDSS
jgi:hypothetical protein